MPVASRRRAAAILLPAASPAAPVVFLARAAYKSAVAAFAACTKLHIGSASASPTACHFEYRNAHARATGMPSAVPIQSRYRAFDKCVPWQLDRPPPSTLECRTQGGTHARALARHLSLTTILS